MSLSLARLINKIIIYSVLTIAVASIFTGILILDHSELATILITSFIIVVIIKPLRNYITKITNKIFLKQSYDYQQTLRDTSQAIASTIEYDKILKLLTNLLTKKLGIGNVTLVNYNDKSMFCEVAKTKKCWPLSTGHPLIRLLKNIQVLILIKDIESWQQNKKLKEELNLANISNDDLEIIKRDLIKRKFAGILPLTSQGQLVGLLAIGQKLSKEPYGTDDAKLLNTIASQVATAMENANLYQNIKESELTIREQHDRIESIITNLTDGLIVTDKNKKIILINPVVDKLFGEQNLQGKSLPQILDQGINEKNIAKTKFPLISEIEIGGKKKAHIRIITAPLFDKQGKRTGYIKILHDITRDKEIDKVKSDFIRTAAHKLRTPLSAVKWILRMILDGDMGKVPPKQKKFLEKSYQSNERMIGVVNALLDVSEIEEGKFNFHFEETEIADIITDILKELKSIANRKRQNLFYCPDENIPKITAAPSKLRAVIISLIFNAIQYTKEGGKINLKLENLGDELKFTVIDNGLGIPKAQQNKLFTKFMRGDNIAQVDTEGNGLNLFIAKHIIEGHKGKIGFQSAQDKGSTFYFTIPIKT